MRKVGAGKQGSRCRNPRAGRMVDAREPLGLTGAAYTAG